VIRSSTNAMSVNGAAAGGQLPVICPPIANPEKQPANPSTTAIRPFTKATSVNGTVARGQLSIICPPVANSEAQDHGLGIPSTPAIRPSTDATSVNGGIVNYVATRPLAVCHENDLLHQNATPTIRPSGSQEGSPFSFASPPSNPYRLSAPTIPTVDNFTGGGASIVGEIIFPRNVEFVAQPIDQVTEDNPLENATTAIDRMSINPTTNDPIDVTTDSPKISLREFNTSVSINHPTVDTCIDEINFTSSSQENEVFNNLGFLGNITDVITANARQPRKQRATATIMTSTRDLRASMRHMNPPSSNRGLKNSSVLCYSNSYFQVLASYRCLPDCLSQPPSDDDRHFPIYATITRCHTAMASEVVVVVFHCKWAQAGPVLFCQRGGCAPYCGLRGAIIQYWYAETLLKTPNIEKYSYSEF
jgi:hypothetical protein